MAQTPRMAGPDDATAREKPGGPAPTAPERGVSDDSTAETKKEAEEQRAMFAASRAVAEGDFHAAYRIACGAPLPMAVARRILEILKKQHPEPGTTFRRGKPRTGLRSTGCPNIPIAVNMSTLKMVLGDLNLRSAAGPTGWTYRLSTRVGI